MTSEVWRECRHHHHGCACREHTWEVRVAELDAEVARLQARLTVTAQILIAEVGADRPLNADDVAMRAVVRIRELAAEVERLKGETYCVYYCACCGKRFLLEASDAKEQIGQHIGECPKHPMRIVEAERDAALAEVARLKAHPVLQFIISEPGPGPEAGRFIEVEDGEGHSICAGQWTQLEDGNWSLTVPYPTGEEEHLKAEVERLKAELREAIKRGAWLQGELTATKGEFVVLKYGHTWEQERAAVVAYCRDNGKFSYADSIESGEHWPEGGSP